MHKPDPMFNAMFVQGKNLKQLVDDKIAKYNGEMKYVKASSMVNDGTTTQKTAPNGSVISLGK